VGVAHGELLVCGWDRTGAGKRISPSGCHALCAPCLAVASGRLLAEG